MTLSLEDDEVALLYKVQIGYNGSTRPEDFERVKKIRARVQRLIQAEFSNVEVEFIQAGR